MKLQISSRIGLYAVLILAQDPSRQLSAADIAEIFDISLNHLAKVMRDLSRAGLVGAVRGAGGGYRFIGNPKRTTLFDVISLFEPPDTALPGPRDSSPKNHIETGLASILGEIDALTWSTLQSVTIDTMLKIISRQERSRGD
ncbi:MAG: Rrf2 family transcriptional regulator [Magnetospiraceae bacterium]